MGGMNPQMNRRMFLGSTVALAGCGWLGGAGGCNVLTEADLDEGIRLAGRYLSTAILDNDEFVYQVDWQSETSSIDFDGVRQAGSTWGLVEHAARVKTPEHVAAADRVFTRWLARKRILTMGSTFVWGKNGLSRMGTTALLGLACADRLRLPDPPPETAATLEGVVQFVRANRRPEGGFLELYDTYAEKARPDRSSYADGEALLFLSTLAVHHGRADLLPEVLRWAEEDWQQNVAAQLASDPDPATTKGYYQWGSMSWANLIAGGHEADKWGQRLTDLATWMVDVHKTLDRSRNTAYAYEGIVPAYVEAKRRGETALADHLACTIHQGLVKLCSWQLGHPRQLAHLKGTPERWQGGVQNHADERWLRIDVTQHQLHALWLAKDSGVVRHFG